MPAPEANGRDQDAVVWDATGRYDRYGKAILDEPRQIEVRWNTKRTSMIGRDGKPIALDATVVTVEDIELDSDMWLGTLEDWYATGSAGNGVSLHTVVAFTSTPDIKAREDFRVLGLMRHKDIPGP